MQRHFPSDYSPDELASEIVRLSLIFEQHLVFFECMAVLAEKVERTTTDPARLKSLESLLELVHFSARTFLEPVPDLAAVA